MIVANTQHKHTPFRLQALQLQGIKIRVRRSEGEYGDLDEILEGTAAAAAAAALDEDDEFGSDLDLDLGLQTDLAEPDDSRGKAKGGGGGGTDWYSSLAAAGFSVRTSATGEVFLERTTTKRKPAAASAAPPAAAAAAAPGNAAAPAATTTAAARSAQKQQVVAAVAAAGTATASSSAAGSPAAAATPAEAAAVAARQLLPPLVGRPAVAAALKLLSTPQQVRIAGLSCGPPTHACTGYSYIAGCAAATLARACYWLDTTSVAVNAHAHAHASHACLFLLPLKAAAPTGPGLTSVVPPLPALLPGVGLPRVGLPAVGRQRLQTPGPAQRQAGACGCSRGCWRGRWRGPTHAGGRHSGVPKGAVVKCVKDFREWRHQAWYESAGGVCCPADAACPPVAASDSHGALSLRGGALPARTGAHRPPLRHRRLALPGRRGGPAGGDWWAKSVASAGSRGALVGAGGGWLGLVWAQSDAVKDLQPGA